MSALADVELLLRRTIGLDPSTVGSARIRSAVQRRMSARGIQDSDAYALNLPRDADELQELVEAVVVPETFFFREPAALSALGNMVRSGLLPASVVQPLHILSLPCSSGEEPYSIAVTLLAAGCAGDAFCIDGVDVSHEAVRRAHEATYHKHSLRGKAPQFPEYFLESRKGIAVRQDVRASVRIVWGNVFAPGFAPPHSVYDVIFCRNLLIYFDASARDRVLEVIAKHLRPNGILFVAPADAPVMRAAGYSRLGDPVTCAFRRDDPVAGTETPASDARVLLRSRTEPGAPHRLSAFGSLTSRGSRAPVTAPEVHPTQPVAALREGIATPDTTLAEVASLANAGRLTDAAALGESVQEAVSGTELFVLLGTIHDKLGNVERAEMLYRRALYLDPGCTTALLHLALLFERQGEPTAAARLRARAQRSARTGSQ